MHICFGCHARVDQKKKKTREVTVKQLCEKCIHERKENHIDYAMVSDFFLRFESKKKKKRFVFAYIRSTGGMWKRKVLNRKMTMYPKMHLPYKRQTAEKTKIFANV